MPAIPEKGFSQEAVAELFPHSDACLQPGGEGDDRCICGAFQLRRKHYDTIAVALATLALSKKGS